MSARYFVVALWFVAQGAALALDPQSLRAAANYSRARHGAAFLVLQNGRTLLEDYPDGEGPRAMRKIYSGTKAFWNLAVLAAVQEGLVNLEEPVAETIPSWGNDPRKSQITIRELVDFSSGLDSSFFIQNTQAIERDAIAVNRPVVGPPGSTFTYGPAALQVAYEVLKRKLRGESPTHYLERRVLRPLGLGPQRYLPDRAGDPLLSTGFVMTARQWAKVGQLVLNGGAPVVSSTTLAQCWRGSSANPAFAFGWWNNRAAPGGHEIDIERMLDKKTSAQAWSGVCVCRDAPSDLVCCIGSLGQRLYVIPSMQLIIVRQANGGAFSDGEFLRLALGQRG